MQCWATRANAYAPNLPSIPLHISLNFGNNFSLYLMSSNYSHVVMKYPYGNRAFQHKHAGGRAHKHAGYMHNIFLLRSRCRIPQVCFPIGKPRSNISLLLFIPRYYGPVYRCYTSVSWDFTITMGCPAVLNRGACNYNSYEWRNALVQTNNAFFTLTLSYRCTKNCPKNWN